MPKMEGGFNIKELLSWNKALSCKLICKLIRKKGVWAIWATDHYLFSPTIWEVIKCHSNAWSWKNLLSIRDYIIEKTNSTHDAMIVLNSWLNEGKFLISRAFDFFRFHGSVFPWRKVIWNTDVIPKHSIFMFLLPIMLSQHLITL